MASKADPVYFVKQNNLDPRSNFSCRYTFQRDKLLPIIDTISATEIGTPNKHSRIENENTPLRNSHRKRKQVFREDDLIKLCEEELTTTPTKSPRLKHGVAVASLEKNAHVKRNLGESFGSPTVLRNLSHPLPNSPAVELCNTDAENTKSPKSNDQLQLVVNLSPLHQEVVKMKSPMKLQSISEFVDVTRFTSKVSKLLFDDDSLPNEMDDPLADPLAGCDSNRSKKVSSVRPKHKKEAEVSEEANKHVRHTSKQINGLIAHETDDYHENTSSSRSKRVSSVRSNYKSDIKVSESNKPISRKDNDLTVEETNDSKRVSSIQTKSKQDVEDTNKSVRRTSRQVKRVSYADFTSPITEQVKVSESVRRSSRQIKRISYINLLSANYEETERDLPIPPKSRNQGQVPKVIELTSSDEEEEERDIITPLKSRTRCSTRLASRSESELSTKQKPDSAEDASRSGATRSSARLSLKTRREQRSPTSESTSSKDDSVALSRPRRIIRPPTSRQIALVTVDDNDEDFSSSDSYVASDSSESESDSSLSEEPTKGSFYLFNVLLGTVPRLYLIFSLVKNESNNKIERR